MSRPRKLTDEERKQRKSDYNRKYRKAHDYDRQWRIRQAASVRNSWLKHQYGITLADYKLLSTAQGGRCAVCGRTPAEGRRKYNNLHVDHDHLTGRVRGLLCNDCNLAIGLLGDTIGAIQNVLMYLQKGIDNGSER